MALQNTEAGKDALKLWIAQLQALNILNTLYCQKLRGQLAHKEKKDGKGKGKMMGDGLPCVLSGDVFYEMVVEFKAWQKGKASKAEAKKCWSTGVAEGGQWEGGKEHSVAYACIIMVSVKCFLNYLQVFSVAVIFIC